MQRIRVTARHNPEDPSEDLRWASRLRRDLWAHSAVEIDPDSSSHSTHRDAERNAYFEFATDHLPEVQRVMREFGYIDRATVDVIQEGNGTECVNCGNIPPELVTVCPKCQFRDIDPCPYCHNEVARLNYTSVVGEVFHCPMCHHRVRLQINDPMRDGNGDFNQPLVCVSPAEAPVEHEV